MAKNRTSQRVQYWDSCLFIALLQDKESEKSITDTLSLLIRDAEAGKLEIVVSPLVVAEVRPNHPSHNSTNQEQKIEELFNTNRSYVRRVAITGAIGREARMIGAANPGLGVIDALHVAAALSAKCDVMFTLDGEREQGKRRRAKDLTAYSGRIGNPPLEITAPHFSIGPLFDPPGGQDSGE